MVMLQTRKATDLIVVHCSATPPSQDIGRVEIDRMHRARGFLQIGYHFVIRRGGLVEYGRPQSTVGAHVEGHNATSVGVCMVGGVNAAGQAEDNFTPAQKTSLSALLTELRTHYPAARIVGHRDLSPDRNHDGRVTPNEWMKDCPSFDVAEFVRAHGL